MSLPSLERRTDRDLLYHMTILSILAYIVACYARNLVWQSPFLRATVLRGVSMNTTLYELSCHA